MNDQLFDLLTKTLKWPSCSSHSTVRLGIEVLCSDDKLKSALTGSSVVNTDHGDVHINTNMLPGKQGVLLPINLEASAIDSSTSATDASLPPRTTD